MKKYIKPAIIARNITLTTIMAGSVDDVKGEYNGTLPLKSKGASASFEDDEFEEEVEEEISYDNLAIPEINIIRKK